VAGVLLSRLRKVSGTFAELLSGVALEPVVDVVLAELDRAGRIVLVDQLLSVLLLVSELSRVLSLRAIIAARLGLSSSRSFRRAMLPCHALPAGGGMGGARLVLLAGLSRVSSLSLYVCVSCPVDPRGSSSFARVDGSLPRGQDGEGKGKKPNSQLLAVRSAEGAAPQGRDGPLTSKFKKCGRWLVRGVRCQYKKKWFVRPPGG
jgi:hypothetical protein